MTDQENYDEEKGTALLLMGCPEVPVQMGIALYLAHLLNREGWNVSVAGNPSVLNLLRVSDPQKHYVRRLIDLDRCIEGIVEKKQRYDLCVVFAHNDAGISYAATMHHILPSRLVTVVFGRNAENLGGQIDFPSETIVEKAVHNPSGLRRKIDEVFRWPASTR
ncbi:MAG: DUF1890 domain-containing protein [Methanomicrobiales archaeon]|nr:DUF1890 domain-containing protein [Methanomicrobiales archaeon]MDI6875630.1 DUF1890 domain-containing protein [Methanomicrobiales archaeon]